MKQYYCKFYAVFLTILFFYIPVSAQKSENLWTKTTKQSLSKTLKVIRKTEPAKATFFKLNINGLKTKLQNAPKRKGFNGVSNVIVSFPNADGSLETYRVLEASVMAEILQEEHPNIRSYVGQSIENPSTIIRFSVTPQGLHTMIFSSNKGIQFMDPYAKNDNSYIVYAKRDLPQIEDRFICGVIDQISANKNNTVYGNVARNANDGMMREYRLAIASTIEYSQFHWEAAGLNVVDTETDKKTAVLAAMVVTMTRVNGVYEKDLSLTMTLVANNKDIIFINSDTFDNTDAGVLIGQSQTVIDATIGTANYDIGHTFSTGGGGLASLSQVCVNGNKAKGITGLSSPVGDAYDIDFVAHEMGHQFGANHTFNGTAGSCAGGNRVGSNAYEPGSGTTIMAYAGICSPQNVQNNSDAYFHQASLLEIWANITTGNSICAVQTATGNSAPTAIAGASFTIPVSTPYRLTGSSTDTDGTSSHTFTWEQYDLGPAGLPLETNLTGPLVRAFEGATSPIRYIPKLIDLMNSGGSSTWEKLASVGRAINFKLTVRDNGVTGGQTAADNMTTTTVVAAGPFIVTSQAAMGISWIPNSTETIAWNVAGTTANGVNTANVNILLSIDGGLTFPTVLVANIPNDGTQNITVPNITASNCRIMVEAVGNIFFNVNTERFSIGNFVTTCTQYASAANLNLSIPDNTGNAVGDIINIPDSKTIDYITVNVDITHDWINDLIIQIQHPNGTTFTNVWNRTCDNEDGLNIIFEDGASVISCVTTPPPPLIISGTYAPTSPLSVFSGLDSAGDWTIEISDNASADTGVLNDWYIEICEATLSIPEFNELTNISIFPNPNSGEFTVKLNSNSGNNIKITVYDIRGRKVFNNTYNNSSNFNEVINLNNVQSGIYLLNVSDGIRSTTKKIIVN